MNHLATLQAVHDPQAAAASLGYGREAIALLGLSCLPGVGFQTLGKLGGRVGIAKMLDTQSVSAVVDQLTTSGARIPRDEYFLADWNEFRHNLWRLGQGLVRSLVDGNIRFLFADDPAFPFRIAKLPDAMRPDWLFVAGSLGLLDASSVAIVGTRSPSEAGTFLAKFAVSAAEELGAPVVSGLAYGIDCIVHEWCLQVGLPTISVLGTGILAPYPARHAPLGDQIVAAGGTLVSEYMPHQGPAGQQFVWRNRLQAALGCATIPVEWKQKSGTAHTVRFSRTLRRPVFGLHLGGVPLPADAGVGDQDFRVPAEHCGFRDAIQKAIASVAVKAPDLRQHDLFA